jgi:hypothetical protein
LDEQGEHNYLLACNSEETIDAWHDGLKILINPKPNANITCFVECLIDAQLLDLHTLNYEIQPNIPHVPQLPSDFEFNLTMN